MRKDKSTTEANSSMISSKSVFFSVSFHYVLIKAR